MPKVTVDELNSNFQNYKRLFVVGCSFTNYIWPTWANILSNEFKTAEIYNFGKSGAGNLYIATQLSIANKKYKFTKDDLVVPMWSTHTREDRYVSHEWITPGNIFTQDYYSADWVKKNSCVIGYLIRDLSIIDTTNTWLNFLPCDSFSLYSVPANYDYMNNSIDDPQFEKIVNLYPDLVNEMNTNLYNVAKHPNQPGWVSGHGYKHPHIKGQHGDIFMDYHPSPARYLKFLISIGFKLSDDTKNYAQSSTEQLIQMRHYKEIYDWNEANNAANTRIHTNLNGVSFDH